MVTARTTNKAYLTEIGNGVDQLFSDGAEEKGGSGKYLRPHDLLETAYPACLNITTSMVLDALHILYEAVTVKVELDCRDEAKTIFIYQVDRTGALDEETKRRVVNLALNCPVKKT
jgi:putative redox protein